MPDAGSSGTGRPGRDKRLQPVPLDWGGTFAALPLETPDADAWQRLQARLPMPAPGARTRWPLWLATAASLALALVIPMRMQPATVRVALPDDAPSPGSNVAIAPGGDNGAGAGRAATTPTLTPAPPVPKAAQTQLAARSSMPARRAAPPPSQRPVRTLAPGEGDTRIAAADSGADLESLYVQSAQLEGLLALARDDRVASGPLAALTEGLDAQVASIDTALIQPDLPSQRRTELWGERVDTLRQLVGVEATQRLLAARGQHYDAALVSID